MFSSFGVSNRQKSNTQPSLTSDLGESVSKDLNVNEPSQKKVSSGASSQEQFVDLNDEKGDDQDQHKEERVEQKQGQRQDESQASLGGKKTELTWQQKCKQGVVEVEQDQEFIHVTRYYRNDQPYREAIFTKDTSIRDGLEEVPEQKQGEDCKVEQQEKSELPSHLSENCMNNKPTLNSLLDFRCTKKEDKKGESLNHDHEGQELKKILDNGDKKKECNEEKPNKDFSVITNPFANLFDTNNSSSNGHGQALKQQTKMVNIFAKNFNPSRSSISTQQQLPQSNLFSNGSSSNIFANPKGNSGSNVSRHSHSNGSIPRNLFSSSRQTPVLNQTNQNNRPQVRDKKSELQDLKTFKKDSKSFDYPQFKVKAQEKKDETFEKGLEKQKQAKNQNRSQKSYTNLNILCVGNKKAYSICQQNGCTHCDAITCANADCQCQKPHKDCFEMCRIDVILRNLEEKRIKKNGFQGYLKSMIRNVNDDMNRLMDNFREESRYFGLNGYEKEFIQLLQENQRIQSEGLSQQQETNLRRKTLSARVMKNYLNNWYMSQIEWASQSEKKFCGLIEKCKELVSKDINSLKFFIRKELSAARDYDYEDLKKSPILKSDGEKYQFETFLLQTELQKIIRNNIFNVSPQNVKGNKRKRQFTFVPLLNLCNSYQLEARNQEEKKLSEGAFRRMITETQNLAFLIQNEYGRKYGLFLRCKLSNYSPSVFSQANAFFLSFDQKELMPVQLKEQELKYRFDNDAFRLCLQKGNAVPNFALTIPVPFVERNLFLKNHENWIHFQGLQRAACQSRSNLFGPRNPSSSAVVPPKVPSHVEMMGFDGKMCSLKAVEIYKVEVV